MRRHGIETVVPLAIAVAASALFLFGAFESRVLRDDSQSESESISMGDVMSADLTGFRVVDGPRAFEFPADHGAHPDYRSEWWYFTGNVTDERGRAFGYQLTFFRTALAPEDVGVRPSRWATRQMYMAHFAVSDIEADRFHAFERFSRGALDLAGAEAPSLRVWLEDWSLEATNSGEFGVRLRAAQDGIEIDLELAPLKEIVLHGEGGFSPKSDSGDAASYYVSYTRLETRGSIRLGDASHRVSGTSWFDHEFGSGALDRTQIGWDWFSVQLEDGRDLMFAQVRDRSGAKPFRAAVLIEHDGENRKLDPEQITFRVESHWSSPATGARYPSGWSLAVPQADLDLEIVPAMSNQEMPLAIRYWEGSTRISGRSLGRDVVGVGYTELTGYAVAKR